MKWVQEFNETLTKEGESLRYGFSTGTCAALATQGAVAYLLLGVPPKSVSLMTPKGLPVTLSHISFTQEGDAYSCSVWKDGGDDIDVTHKAEIKSTVEKCSGTEIIVKGGKGVGTVTRKGLPLPVGSPAINPVPLSMIIKEAALICKEAGYLDGLEVTISVPNGEELARKTFNSQLGIMGGLSILGTGGIVEPKSLAALIETIKAEVKMHGAEGADKLIGVPGNYGESFLKNQLMLDKIPYVKYSNFIGDFLDSVKEEKIKQVLLVGHMGKMVKVAGGLMNTHSAHGDCRREIFAAYGGSLGAPIKAIQEILTATTTDDCLTILEGVDLKRQTVEEILKRIDFYTGKRVGSMTQVGSVVFSNQLGLLGISPNGKEILEGWKI